jgi:hypothetical protein
MQKFLDWLVADFDFYGLQLQHWMLLAGGIFVIFIAVSWLDHRRQE